MKLRIIILLGLLQLSSQLLSQVDSYRFYEMEEDSLNLLFDRIANTKSDSLKIEINNSISEMLEYILYDENSFSSPLDSVKYFGIITSDDNLVHIYNWNILFSDNTYKYFGFIQYYNESKNEYFVFKLNDKSDLIEKPENQILSNDNWYGALYYKIIESDDKKYKYYTLLGWDGNTEWSSKKIIDVLYFTNSGNPRFGANIFYNVRQGDKREKIVRQKRILFEYNSKVNMTLTFDDKMKMIVFDHLSPNDSYNSDDFRYYGPDWKYCGLKFKKGKWRYYTDIDPRNPKPNKKPFLWKYNKLEDLY